MRFNREIELGINFISKLDHRPKRCADIARDIGADLHFAEQVARRLRLAGLIHSVRGPGGGYTKARLVAAFDVFKALQGESEFNDSSAGHVQAMVAETLKNTLI